MNIRFPAFLDRHYEVSTFFRAVPMNRNTAHADIPAGNAIRESFGWSVEWRRLETDNSLFAFFFLDMARC
jgi:hypothetical protein